MSLPKYKYLITYRLSEIIYDNTYLFCQKYLATDYRTKDQMIQAARSTKQNIIEGISEVASGEELIADYEDFLRKNNLHLYPKTDPKIAAFRALGLRLSHLSNLSNLGNLKEKPALPASAEEKFIHEGGYSENLFKKRITARNAFTLMEVTIVIGLIVTLLTAAIVLLNPIKQIEKAWDGKRKHELGQLRKVLEDYYNDKQYYPSGSTVCYDGITPDPVNPSISYCDICGKNSGSPPFSPYLRELPCDPQYSQKNYRYQYDTGNTNPQWYRLCTLLSTESSTSTYNYAVASPNQSPDPLQCVSTCPSQGLYCIKNGCNFCDTLSNCQSGQSCDQPLQLYGGIDGTGHCINACR